MFNINHDQDYATLRNNNNDKTKNLTKIFLLHLKRRKTDHEQQRDIHASGLKGSERWATRTAKHAPSSAEVNPEEVSLIDSGACGAFVYGLEDELLEVC